MTKFSAAHRWLIVAALVTAAAAVGGAQQTFAPHEKNSNDAPAPIAWPPPPLPTAPVAFDSAEEHNLRLVVLTDRLEQPWSVAFLPDDTLLITERAGRLRIMRHGVLDPKPVESIPPVQTGGPRGLQGLMDVALHPRFADNHWIYFVYHKPVGEGDEGATTLARGTWNGTRLVDVHDIFASGAVGTEASRIAFGRDGMLYLTISAPGSPNISRAQDPNDYAGKVVRLRDDGRVPSDNPFVGRVGYKPAIFTMDTATATASP